MPQLKPIPPKFTVDQRKAYSELSDDIYQELKSLYGTSMTKDNFMEYWGVCKQNAQEELEDVPFWLIKQKKVYRTIDIARVLAERRIGINLSNLEGIRTVDLTDLNVPSLLVNAFISECKKLKLTQRQSERATELLTDNLRKGKWNE